MRCSFLRISGATTAAVAECQSMRDDDKCFEFSASLFVSSKKSEILYRLLPVFPIPLQNVKLIDSSLYRLENLDGMEWLEVLVQR